MPSYPRAHSELTPSINSSSLPSTSPPSLPKVTSKRKASTLFASAASKIIKASSSKGHKLPDHPDLTKIKTPSSSNFPTQRGAYVDSFPDTLSAARRTPGSGASPNDKPLPSLPVATIVGKSPIQRRSLIDATERPLRRSASVPPPDQAKESGKDEWPALSPNRPALKQHEQPAAKPTKPSVGESVIEALRDFHIGTRYDSVHPLAPDKVSSSSSALPRPTGYRKRHPSAAADIQPAEVAATPANLPRSKSILHHTATGRGSPYTFVTNSSNDSSPSLQTAKLVSVKEVKTSTATAGKTKTSIPLPSRLIRHPTKDENIDDEAAAAAFMRCSDWHPAHGLSSPCDVDVDVDADYNVDTEHKSSNDSSPLSVPASLLPPPPPMKMQQPLVTPKSRTRTHTRVHSRSEDKQMTLDELMGKQAIIKPDQDDASDHGSMRGFDSDGGFRIKKIRRGCGRQTDMTTNTSSTLRINDSAKELLEDSPEQGAAATACMASGPDAHDSNHLTKTTEMIKSKIQDQIDRSISRRSITARLSSDSQTKLTGPEALKEEDDEYDGDGDYKNENTGDNDSVINHGHRQVSQESYVLSDTSNKAHDALAAPTTPRYPPGGHHDWPLKDFNALATGSAARPACKDQERPPSSGRASSESSWIPPADWGVVKKRPSALDLTADQAHAPAHAHAHSRLPRPTPPSLPPRNHFSSPTPPPGPPSFGGPSFAESTDADVAGDNNGHDDGHDSKDAHEAEAEADADAAAGHGVDQTDDVDNDIPPPTPEKDAIYLQHPSVSSSLFPPRTSSKAAPVAPNFAPPPLSPDSNCNDYAAFAANASANATINNHNGYLSPIHEMSENTLASILGRQDSQNTLRFFATPVASAAAAAAAPTAREEAPTAEEASEEAAGATGGTAPSTRSTPKMVSAIRNLFHKKSSELGRAGSIRKRSRARLYGLHGGQSRESQTAPTPPVPTTFQVTTHENCSFDDGSTLAPTRIPVPAPPSRPPSPPPPPPPPPPPTPTRPGDEYDRADDDRTRSQIHRIFSSSAPTSTRAAVAPADIDSAHLLALAVAAGRDAEDALVQARLAVDRCEACVERTTSVVNKLRESLWTLN